MNEIKVIGIDLAKSVFQTRLIPTQHVKALTHHQENDVNDALAICETVFCPGIHFVAIKKLNKKKLRLSELPTS